MSEAGDEPIKNIPGLPKEEEAAARGLPFAVAGKAEKEAKLLSQGFSVEQIKDNTEINNHLRNERFKNHFETISIIGLWIISLLFLLMSGLWLWHLAMPDNWHWLTEENISKIQNILTGGILAGIGTEHIKKRLR